MENQIRKQATVGVFAVGHAVYWGQFPGLLDKLMTYHADFVKLLEKQGVKVVDFGMSDSSERAYEMLDRIRASGVDLLFCNMVTYATSSVFAPIARDSGLPIVLTALQPLANLDYTQANTRMQLENDCICAVPEFTGVAKRLGHPIRDCIIGKLYDDPEVEKELDSWCRIARVLHNLHGARIGLIGHTMEAMYDMHTDPTAASAAFDIHVPLLEINEIVAMYNAVKPEDTTALAERIDATFDTPDPVSDPVTMKLTPEDREHAIRAAAALNAFIAKHHLTGLAYYYEGQPESEESAVVSSFIVGNSLLIEDGYPMCGEYDLKTCIAMLILDRLGIGGSFAEFHPIDFGEDFILVGHDGPHHIAIAEGKPVLRSLKKYHGKPGHGASVEFKIKEGPITMLGISQTPDGKFRFVIGEGYSKAGPIPPTGNTNTRGFFAPTTREFMKKWVMEGPTHHFALGVGHHADEIAKIAEILGVPAVIVR